jgi:tellurite resistance protein
VFLYFYGLERRALFDAKKSAAARDDLPGIDAEVERLLSIYSGRGSFPHYANAFLDVIRVGRYPQRSYMTPPAAARPGSFPFSYKLALAQCANDQVPVPAAFAFAWLMADPTTRLRAPATRCPDYFRVQFLRRYQEDNAEGMRLPKNKTRLKLLYQSASGSFRNAADQPRIELDLPDVSVLTAPIKKLQSLADRTCDDLDGYSRLIGKHPEVGTLFDGLLELPFGLWPETHRRPFEVARVNVEKTGLPVAVPLDKLQAWLPAPATISKRNFQKLCGRLAEAGLGIEPDVRYGGVTPTSGSRVVLFSDPASMNESKRSARYEAAALTIQLAAAVASADGKPDDGDRIFLLERLETWLHLSEPEKARLHARLRLELSGAPRLSGLKRTIEALDAGARKAIGDFVVLVAQADAVVTAAEIRTLERIFKLLLLEPAGLYAKLHVAATEPVTVMPAGGEKLGHAIPAAPAYLVTRRLGLDPNKVLALQKDSERLAGILSKIFEQEDEPVTKRETFASESPVGHPVEPTLFGLDLTTSGFARTLLGRSQWTRAELEELAGDRELMVDGTLEKINDACIDALQQPLTEGVDPIDINQAVVREVIQ